MWYWFSAVCYIIASQIVVGILAWSMLITIAVSFILGMVALGGIAWKVAQRSGEHEKRTEEDTLTLPSVRARKMREKYLQ